LETAQVTIFTSYWPSWHCNSRVKAPTEWKNKTTKTDGQQHQSSLALSSSSSLLSWRRVSSVAEAVRTTVCRHTGHVPAYNNTALTCAWLICRFIGILWAFTAQTGYIVPQEYEIYCAWPGTRQKHNKTMKQYTKLKKS